MIRVEIKSNIEDVRRRFATLAKDVEEKATVSALNRTATTVRAAAVREIRKEYPGLKAGGIRDELAITRATRARLEATVTLRGSRIPLINFGARQTRRGVSVQVKRGRTIIPHAFIATMKNGHRGVFVRIKGGKPLQFRYGPGSRIAKKGRDLPIAELTGISLPRAFVNRNVQAVLKRLAADTFTKNFAAGLAYRSR